MSNKEASANEQSLPKAINVDEEIEKLSHEELLEITDSSLRRLIAADSLLNDLPGDVTTDEVLSQIAVAQGQSITVTVLRFSETPLSVVIPQKGTTVRDLKKAIQRTFTLLQRRTKSRGQISWRYVWKTYNLQHQCQVLDDDTQLVSHYGIPSDNWKYPWLEQIFRQEEVSQGCANYLTKFSNGPRLNISRLDHILVDHGHRLLYCYVPKVACTNWKRVFMVLTGSSNLTDPLSISADVAHNEHSTLKLSELPDHDATWCLERYTTFLVVRHPFERLLSAYRNKFAGEYSSAKYFQKRYGRHIVRNYRPKANLSSLSTGADVTFWEFAQYLIHEGSHTNEHWAPIYHLCRPCLVNYDLVARYERLSEDSRTVLSYVGAPPLRLPVTRAGGTRAKLREYFQELSIRDIERLYRIYEPDFKLFGYGLEDILGFDFG